ncbi:MAG TPA: type IV secretion system protein VirB10 [Hydrogenophaga sp.]|uniref:type IV secretion system protein VirB10 n=1 Tax=Hydrogenophaga sp. TaxID=1904254 RepID=UPI000E8C2163|nr:type IV secretion system protein VirB10 [Hydrogenophaga sp.]HAX21047.1 type IV secretion system protein VirB10 [Hydrogenophaga sp.]HBU17729.1 type IV secretion system protein VirB10 [Hydrogenophaga sp.]
MNDQANAQDPSTAEPSDGNTITPLPGEPGIPQVTEARSSNWSRKGALGLGMMVLTLVLFAGFAINRYLTSGSAADEDSKMVRDKPSAASAGTRALDMTAPPTPRIPALLPTNEVAEPIEVRSGAPASPKGPSADDAPVLIVSLRPGALSGTSGMPNATVPGDASANPDDPVANTGRNLQAYQRQLQGLLDNLTQSTAMASGQGSNTANLGAMGSMAGASPGAGLPAPVAGLFGGQLQGSATPKVAASTLGDRSLTLPKGTAFTCALKTKVISATSGLVGCQVQRNVYGDNGRVLLIERGSHLDGEYRISSVRPGIVRIPVLWTRVRTPHGVTVDIESPGTGQLGESGIDGFVDNRWGERIGAAMLLSLIDDSVKLVIQNQTQDQQADTIVLPSTTDNTSKLAEKVLDSTINIPPLLYQNQGGIVGIYVARDVDFSSVYELQPRER